MIFSAAQQTTETIKIAMGLIGKLIEKQGWKPSDTGYALAVLGGMLVCAIVPYLLGSINPAILISKLFYHQDIRSQGSGNAGTTNMLRTYGKGAALATLLIDLGKACVAVLFGRIIYGVDGSAIAGFFVILGHMFPLYHRFKGGKGVACLAMVVLTISPLSFLILLGIFIVIVAGTRFVSLASVMCAMLYPLILQAFSNNGLNVAMAVLSALMVVYMHRSNIKRLWNGNESKISFSKKKKGTESVEETETTSEQGEEK